jgi:hypothetical protein
MNSPLNLATLGCLFVLAAASPAIPAGAADSALPEVKPADLSKLSPADFADEDLDLPFYLFHFHTVANAVESDGPDRGFIQINVWRKSHDSFNARIMENILSLAWFYCADRKWNPYRGDAALRARLEAALDFWIREQLPDGQFPESGPGKGDLAATAFATKFIGEALLLLHSGPPIDPAILEKAEAADRRAIETVLTQPKMYSYGSHYENQFGGVWVGGLAYFALHPDPGLRSLWEKVYHQSRSDFQSPAGYYYEKRGPDFEYTMDTHGHNSRQIWPWLRGTPLGDELIAKDAAWFDWLAYNAPPEPDGAGFILNRAIETRQRAADFTSYETPLGESIPLVRAFSESVEERAARYARKRAALAAAWPGVAPLQLGEMSAFSPYVFLHRRSHEWLPSTAERNAARALLPVNARDHFTQQRRDSKQNIVFTFARRPAYYAAFTSGAIITTQQRYGLGLLWTPKLGAVLQSQTGTDPEGHPHRLASQLDSDAGAWGTQPAAAKTPSEATGVNASFSLNKAPLPESTPGIHDLPDGEFTAHYAVEGGGEKTLTFGEDSIRVTVRHAGEFSEILPFLVPADGRLVPASDKVTLETPRGKFQVSFNPGATASISDPSASILKKRVVVVTLRARDELSYTLETTK